MENQENKPNTGGKSAISRIAPGALIAIALGVFFAMGWHEALTLDSLRENRGQLQEWVNADPALAIGIFILLYAAAVAISFPGASILTIFGGYLFGLAVGVPAIIFAATLGASIVYLAARTALGDMLSRNAGGIIKRMEQGFREDELSYMFISRLAPVFPFWAVNIAAGVLGVSSRNFIVGTFFGIIPGTFVYASIGNAAGAAFDAGQDVTLSGILFKPTTLLPIIGLIILSIIPIIIKRMRNTAQPEKDPIT